MVHKTGAGQNGVILGPKKKTKIIEGISIGNTVFDVKARRTEVSHRLKPLIVGAILVLVLGIFTSLFLPPEITESENRFRQSFPKLLISMDVDSIKAVDITKETIQKYATKDPIIYALLGTSGIVIVLMGMVYNQVWRRKFPKALIVR